MAGGKGVAAVAVGAAALAGLALTNGVDFSSRRAPAAADDAAGAAVPEDCRRPYADWGPWNTPLVRAVRDASRRAPLAALAAPLTSDPTQYTFPVYNVSSATPRRAVQLSGWYSDVSGGGRTLRLQRAGTVDLPIPPSAEPSDGSDGQIVLRDPLTGDEWGAWRVAARGDGTWAATNAYHYNTRWSGVPPRATARARFMSRGAGVPYLAGLVRPCEIRRGSIRHALALAYPYPSRAHVFPATKSDGLGPADELPEGTRLQLDPALTKRQLERWGCSGACLTVARALQRYGAYVVDNGGRPKVMMEYERTAEWDGLVSARTPSPIPLSRLGVVVNTAPELRALRPVVHAASPIALRYVVFDHGDATRETVTIRVRDRTIATLARPFHRARSDEVVVVRWSPPRSVEHAAVCVRAWDAAGHVSRPSCRSVALR